MLAPFVDKLELAPKVERGRCDLSCLVERETVFVEVTTWIDKFPPPDGKLHARATVERSFDPTSKRDDASKQLRDRIVDRAGSPLGRRVGGWSPPTSHRCGGSWPGRSAG
ncbi:MAG: hypothetical protein ACREMC_10010 [Gemmatimonadales bacterium]